MAVFLHTEERIKDFTWYHRPKERVGRAPPLQYSTVCPKEKYGAAGRREKLSGKLADGGAIISEKSRRPTERPVKIDRGGEEHFMHSKAYLEAKKEFVNCIVMSPICLGVSLFLAFTEWYPIMKRESLKEVQGEQEAMAA